MMNIALINASFLGATPSLPIGTLILAKIMKEHGYGTSFYDYQLCQSEKLGSPEHFLGVMEQAEADLIGITVFANSLPMVIKSVNAFKKRHPGKFVVLGGPGVADISHGILQHCSADAIAKGEGEKTLPELAASIGKGQSLETVQGLLYIRDGQVMETGTRELLETPDYYPDYSLVDLQDYGQTASIITARGCPYSCTFCAKPIWKHGVRFRSMDNVFAELHELKHRVRKINICDDTFVFAKQRLEEFCRRYIDEKIGVPWECTGRIGLMNEETLGMLRDAGCETLFFGIESASQKVLDSMDKRIRFDDVERQIELARKYMKHIYKSYIWGLPEETLEDFHQTIMEFTLDSMTENVHPMLNLATPFASTALLEKNRTRLHYLPNNIYNGSNVPNRERFEDDGEMKGIVLDHPEIFSSFYYIDHADFQEKLKIINQLRQNRKAGLG